MATVTVVRSPFQTTVAKLSAMRGTFEVAAYTDYDRTRVTGFPQTVDTVKARAQFREWLPVTKHEKDGSIFASFNGEVLFPPKDRPIVARQVTL